MTQKILHISTVHPRTDVRIFVKELSSIQKNIDADYLAIVQDGLPDGKYNGVLVKSAGPKFFRQRYRILVGIWRMLWAVLREKPTLVHFHDPELILVGFVLKAFGIKVVYDVHEDVPKQLMHNRKMPRFFNILIGHVYGVCEWLAVRVFDACVVVVPTILERLKRHNVLMVTNFPSLEEFPCNAVSKHVRIPGQFVYAGGIVGVRGISEMVDALGLVADSRANLTLLGTFQNETLEAQLRSNPAWPRVNFLGWCDRDAVVAELSKSSAGLVLLHPTPQYKISYPVKMFEYMAAGLPVIASDFPLWREIIDGAQCGILVDPLDPREIADAMQWIIDHPKEACEMGRRGRTAIELRYNWEKESKKLIMLYRGLLSQT